MTTVKVVSYRCQRETTITSLSSYTSYCAQQYLVRKDGIGKIRSVSSIGCLSAVPLARARLQTSLHTEPISSFVTSNSISVRDLRTFNIWKMIFHTSKGKIDL